MRQLQRRVLPQDRLLQLAQRRARLDPQLFYQRPPRRLVDGERVGLPAATVQREHQLGAHALAQRVLGGERLQLGDQIGVATERQIGLDPLLQHREAKLLQPRDRRLRERLVAEVGKRRPAP